MLEIKPILRSFSSGFPSISRSSKKPGSVRPHDEQPVAVSCRHHDRELNAGLAWRF
jgi:hypothetical protein